jgi:hypothetical protein
MQLGGFGRFGLTTRFFDPRIHGTAMTFEFDPKHLIDLTGR